MTGFGKLTRRAFVIAGAAIAGGVAFGAYKVVTPHKNPLLEDLEPGAVSFNPFIKITADGITLITPHVDFGQGAVSMQAALIAEELDVELDQFRTDPGPPDAAYYNTALADDAVPFMSTDRGFIAQSARATIGTALKLLGVQVTGGSSSVPDSFDKLRLAGAVARETLKEAAAQHSGIARAQLSTQSGAVILPDGSRLSYTELAVRAGAIDRVEDVVLRDPSSWRFIGKPMQRLDIVAKSTGQQAYGIDKRLDGMLFASVRLNPQKGGGLEDFDAATARDMPGVRHVVPVTGGVAVVADNTWYAFQALDEISYTWGTASYPAEQSDHWAALAASFTKERLDKVWRDDGDVAKALQTEASETVEYRAPYVAHQPLEPLNATVLVTDSRADVWSSVQMPRMTQDRVAKATGLDAKAVHIHNQFAGGSFGHRLEFDVVDRAVEIALHLKGTPIQLTYSREEDFAQDYTRQIGMARARFAASSGQVDALELEIASPSVTRSQLGRAGMPAPGPDPQIAAGAWNMPYAIAHLRVSAFAAPGLAPVSSWRAVGAATAGFFGECALDEAIYAAGGDAMGERLRLVNDPVARAVLHKAADLSEWGKPLARGQGRGVALVTSFGVPVAEVVEVTDTNNGIRIDRVIVVADVGRIVDPINFENIMQGGVIWGLGHAINSQITYAQGVAEQSNYHDGAGLRLYQTPEIIVQGLENSDVIRGIGEPPVPPAAPALANAIFAATGKRLRTMPFDQMMDFV